MSKINLLLLVADTWGGGGTHTLSLANGLSKEKYSITIGYSPSSQGFQDGIQATDVAVKEIEILGINGINELYNLLSAPFNIVHFIGARTAFQGLMALQLLENYKKPGLIYSAVNFALNQCKSHKERSFRIAMHRFIGRNVDFIITNADYEEMIELKLAPASRIVTIYNGVNPDPVVNYEHCQSIQNNLGLQPNDKLIVFVGRLVEQKGVSTLLQAFTQINKSLPKTKLIIVGDGDLYQPLKNYAVDLGIDSSVYFVGWRDDVNEFIALGDLLILPSFWEGLPSVLLEALAQGKPVIATRVNGIPNAVTHGIHGLLVEPGEPNTLAEAAITLLQDQSLATKFGLAGREQVINNFTEHSMIVNIDQIYDRIVTQIS